MAPVTFDQIQIFLSLFKWEMIFMPDAGKKMAEGNGIEPDEVEILLEHFFDRVVQTKLPAKFAVRAVPEPIDRFFKVAA